MGRPNPCPFCRGTEVHLVRYEQNGSLCCSGCGAQGPITVIGDASHEDATGLATAAWDTGTPRMTHSPDGASAGGLDLDELEKQLRLAVRRATLVYSDGSPYGVQQAADDAWALVLRALSPSPGLGGGEVHLAPNVRGQEPRSSVLTSTPCQSEWRPEVQAFANLMEAKLRENDHKPGWKGEDASDLFPRIAEEADELWRAMVRHSKRLSWGDGWVMETDTVERIGREAADVANFAMMIADVCGALSSEAPSPKSPNDR